jgi:hypothetical protein
MKPEPCKCILHPFPHRRVHACRVEEDGTDRDDRDYDQELIDADNRERARDCLEESRRGQWA